MKRNCLLLLLVLCAVITAHGKPGDALKREIQGFRVYVREDSVSHPELNAMLELLDDRLANIKTLVSEKQFSFFQKVPIWIDWQQSGQNIMRYNTSARQLKKRGESKRKLKCVEIIDPARFINVLQLKMPLIVLHEFAHAYHFRVLKKWNKDVWNAYQHACGTTRYDSVYSIRGGMHKAYAIKNVDEYFAELTETWFGDNDFFPHNREQLKDFDPVGYELMRKTWE